MLRIAICDCPRRRKRGQMDYPRFPRVRCQVFCQMDSAARPVRLGLLEGNQAWYQDSGSTRKPAFSDRPMCGMGLTDEIGGPVAILQSGLIIYRSFFVLCVGGRYSIPQFQPEARPRTVQHDPERMHYCYHHIPLHSDLHITSSDLNSRKW